MNLSDEQVQKVTEVTHHRLNSYGYNDMHLEGDYLTAKKHGESLQVGDIRIIYCWIPCGPASIVA